MKFIKKNPEYLLAIPAGVFLAVFNWPFTIGLLACVVVIVVLDEVLNLPEWLNSIILNIVLIAIVVAIFQFTGASIPAMDTPMFNAGMLVLY